MALDAVAKRLPLMKRKLFGDGAERGSLLGWRWLVEERKMLKDKISR